MFHFRATESQEMLDLGEFELSRTVEGAKQAHHHVLEDLVGHSNTITATRTRTIRDGSRGTSKAVGIALGQKVRGRKVLASRETLHQPIC